MAIVAEIKTCTPTGIETQVHRREGDLSKYINQLKSASDKAGLVEDSLDPYEWAK